MVAANQAHKDNANLLKKRRFFLLSDLVKDDADNQRRAWEEEAIGTVLAAMRAHTIAVSRWTDVLCC